MSKLLQKLKAEYKALEVQKMDIAFGALRTGRPFDEELIAIQTRQDELWLLIEAEKARLEADGQPETELVLLSDPDDYQDWEHRQEKKLPLPLDRIIYLRARRKEYYKKLDEFEIAASYVGKPCDAEKLAKTFKDNGTHKLDFFEENKVVKRLDCQMYIAYCHHFSDEVREFFGISDRVAWDWKERGINFFVNVYTEQGKIVRCGISKDRYTHIGFDRPRTKELKPTKQEIRIFRRIMDYLTSDYRPRKKPLVLAEEN